MSRRIAIAILVTIWTALLAGGLIAYWTTRTVLIGELDSALMARAAALAGPVGDTPILPEPDERVVILDAAGRALTHPALNHNKTPLHIENAKFVALPDGRRLRTLALRLQSASPQASSTSAPATIVYSGSADSLDHALRHLAIALTTTAIVGGVAAAFVAVIVARRALSPLHAASIVLGSIDERALDQRIATENLLPELIPIVQRLNEMLTRLEQAFEQRRQFLADASHELRTPVAALITTIEVALRRQRTTDEHERYLKTCLSDARVLRQLVETLLERARSDNAVHNELVISVDVSTLLNECITIASGLAEEKSISVGAEFPDGLIVSTQPQRLRSVITNLLANAIEYNRAGGSVNIGMELSHDRLTIAITDTGVGIAKQDLANIFQPFYRADPSRDSSGGSAHLGLGLFLVQTHLQALGGKCVVNSREGEGSTFRIELPVVHSEKPVAGSHSALT